MAAPRLTTSFWVQVQVRLCDREAVPAAIVHKGDPDAGTVLLKLNRLADGCTVYARASTAEGRPAWVAATGPAPVPEAEADAYVTRAIKRDPDLWVLEIEDRHARYTLDGPVI